MSDFDVIVVGGGPAGATSALKCSKLGLKVLLIEREAPYRHKPCGGIIPPVCADIISEEFGSHLPSNTMCSPKKLGLYYVPPSGRKNGGSLRNYSLFNVHRGLLDQWFCHIAAESGAQIRYKTEFLEFQQSDPLKVLVRNNAQVITYTTRYLIGADGVYSRVRRQLSSENEMESLPILQEHWKAEGDFDNFFYAFLQGELTPAYAYVIPKDGLYIIGIGVPKTHSTPLSACMHRFKEWLVDEFTFKPQVLQKREVGAIPYGSTFEGRGNVILTGDAAGYCNAFSGEGVRLAIESGVAAGEAIQEALSSDKHLEPTYANCVEWIKRLISTTHKFAVNLQDEDRTEFVKSEIARISVL